MEVVVRLRRWAFGLPQADIDVAAFSDLYDYYLPRVFGYVASLVGNQTLAEDRTAVVFEKAWMKLVTYRGDRGAFSTWLFTIAPG